MLKRAVLVGGVSLPLLVWGAVVLVRPERRGGTAAAPPRGVVPAPVRETRVGAVGEPLVGVVISRDAVEVASKLEGQVAEVRVRIGDRVARDQVLVTLDPRPFRNDLRIAQAALRSAEVDRGQADRLLTEAREVLARRDKRGANGEHLVAEEDVARARHDVSAKVLGLAGARAMVDQKRIAVEVQTQKLADAEIRAPIEGRVAVCAVSPGATVARGAPVVRLVGAGAPSVRFAIPEEQAGSVAPGQPVRVTVDGIEEALAGAVEKVAPEVDAPSRTIIAEARLTVPPAVADRLLFGAAARVAPARRGTIDPERHP